MSATAMTTAPWWKEPTKEQWHAWVAAWLGWTLDAFDFSIFLLIMLPIAQNFNVPLTAVTAVFTITLWLRLAGATAAGWLSDRIGRKKPLMISILWYSICNLLAGIAPSFGLLFLFRALLGIGMGAEWPCGAALAMETWPQRSRGLMAGILQASWGIGALLSSAAYRALVQARFIKLFHRKKPKRNHSGLFKGGASSWRDMAKGSINLHGHSQAAENTRSGISKSSR
jgi:SHS family lactate transporter-like MFS transporter